MADSNLVDDIRSFSYEGQRVGHESDLYGTVSSSDEFDNVVADLNVVLAGLDQTLSLSSDRVEDAENILDTPLHELSENRDFAVKTFPDENFSIMEDIARETALYVPNHVMECLPKALEKQFGGTGHYTEAEKIHDGIFKFLNLYGEPLDVKERMGLDYYTQSTLRSIDPSKTEDNYIMEAASELEGDTVIMTYDADYLGLNIPAAAPKAIEHVLDS